ncbi:MAG: hypothetical protein P4M15_08275 [Alphaproteobacteria bacterium]|nr:hypothetical protein [Alphaproteobacteria bacterium]
MRLYCTCLAVSVFLFCAPAFAEDMTGMDMGETGTPAAPAPQKTAAAPPPAMDMREMKMAANLGSYAAAREGSGTSWQPDSSPHEAWHFMEGDWAMMAHGNADLTYDSQGGPRGDAKLFGSGWGMMAAQHAAGANGTVNFRTMLSLDPFMGSRGYPLLFATGETADGKNALVDRQHPHDLFDEISGSYSYRVSPQDSVFIYGGLPGEPALGPTAFMHRASAGDNPEAPLTHHWLDSTHVAFGVLTAGYVHEAWKLEASAFRGREPDQYRYDIEQPKLDSVSTRLSYNPTENWSFQTSWGYIKSPEQLTPDVNENRLTASGTYNLPFDGNNWATTFAWGRKINQPGNELDGFLLESALSLEGKHTFFGRAERVDEDELLDGTPLEGQPVTVNKFSLGYVRDFPVAEHLKYGVGGLVSQYAYPSAVRDSYGAPPTSFMLFMRLKVI